MGLFDKFKKKQNYQDYRKLNEEEYYIAKPNFYEHNNEIVGICTLTEGVLTLLQKELNYAVNEKKIENYKLAIFSMTDDKVIAHLDYDKAIKVLENIAQANSDNYILVELNLEELRKLIDECNGEL